MDVKENTKTLGKFILWERVGRLIGKSAFVFKITSCDLSGILYRIYMFHLFIEKDFESKGGKKKRKRKRKRERRKEERRRKWKKCDIIV